MLPDGAHRSDAPEKRVFWNQAMKHGVSWYEYANVTRGRMAENGSLYLVTGTDKTTSWNITAFSNANGGEEVSVKLTAAQVVSGNLSGSHHWEINSPAIVRTGSSSQHDVSHDQNSAGISSVARAVFSALDFVPPPHRPANQCVFTRGYCISLRDGVFDALISGQKVTLVDEVDPAMVHLSKSGTKQIPFNTRSSRFSLKRQKYGRTESGGHAGTYTAALQEDEAEAEDVIVDQMPFTNGVCQLGPTFGYGLSLFGTGIQPRKDHQSVAP
jgi:hypothetical protein